MILNNKIAKENLNRNNRLYSLINLSVYYPSATEYKENEMIISFF